MHRLVWRVIGRQTELLDVTLDGFVQRTVLGGGYSSVNAEIVAETVIALAMENKQIISASLIGRLINVCGKR